MSELRRYGSRYNWMDDSLRESSLPRSVLVHDLTLEGDGEEMAGVRISEPDMIEIAKRLSALGVPRISVLGNSPRPTIEEVASAEKIVSLGLPTKLGAFVKTEAEIETAVQIGLWGVTILVGVNDALLPGDMTGADIIERSRRMTRHAKERGLHSCFMAMDSTRTRPEFLKEVVLAVEPDCDEITIADSAGVVSPYGIRYLIREVTSWTDRPIQVHCHNHSSMAVANALAAILGGASVVHTTVNGIGELSGLCSLEEFAVAGSMHLGVSTGIDLEGLKDLSDLVARASGVPVSIHKPAVGEHSFYLPETEDIQEAFHELARLGRLEDGLPYPPRLVGNEWHMAIGRKCNEFTVRHHLSRQGWVAEPSTIREIVAEVRRRAESGGPYYLIKESDFLSLVTQGGYALRPLEEEG